MGGTRKHIFAKLQSSCAFYCLCPPAQLKQIKIFLYNFLRCVQLLYLFVRNKINIKGVAKCLCLHPIISLVLLGVDTHFLMIWLEKAEILQRWKFKVLYATPFIGRQLHWSFNLQDIFHNLFKDASSLTYVERSLWGDTIHPHQLIKKRS